MKFRTKIYFALVGITLLGTLISLGVLSLEIRKDLFHELRNKAISIASTAAATIDGDKVEQIDLDASEKTPEYIEFASMLRRIRDANRSGSTYVKYIYTILPDPQNPNRGRPSLPKFAPCNKPTSLLHLP